MSEVRRRVRYVVSGVVQGVGFRPYVYALSRRLGLSGSVVNDSRGVTIEVEGWPEAVDDFGRRLPIEAPPLAHVDDVVSTVIPVVGGTDFAIGSSRPGAGRTLVSPDVATCDDCLAELADPADRRYRHAFISCTNCGPRFTVITDLPYDRPNTTMAPLPLCAACAADYADPADRRFHAQTVACPDCGPTLTLHRPGSPDLTGTAALAEARRLLAGGAVLAVKGLGGYHLACDATDQAAVSGLRKRKDRGDKPFAIMVADLAVARAYARLSPAEEKLLTDPRRPVVLLPGREEPRAFPNVDRHPDDPSRAGVETSRGSSSARVSNSRAGRGTGDRLAPDVAPDSPDLGVMLPYTPVHRLLFGLPGDPPGPKVLVMTSGNLGGEPIVTDDAEARDRLAALADAWLSHDRAIEVPCDDSVVRVVAGLGDEAELPVRRSRGFAPLPVALPVPVRPALAVGSDLKNTFCVGSGGYAWLSGHVGDMDDLATLRAFERATEQLQRVTAIRPEVLIADRHPGFRSTGWAKKHAAGRELILVQHHHAHLAAAMAENRHPGDRAVIGLRLRRHRLRRRRRGLGRRDHDRGLRRLRAGRAPPLRLAARG